MRSTVRLGVGVLGFALSFTAARGGWACTTDADCTTTPSTPLCDTSKGTCAACTNDYPRTRSRPLGCPDEDNPACNTSGPLAGQCTQCSPSNKSECLPG